MRPDFVLPGVELYYGDCLKILPTLAKGRVDAVVTDPPYGHNNNDRDLIANWEAALGLGKSGPPRPIANDGPEANDLFRAMLSEARRLLVPGGCCCCCCGGGGGPDPQFARWSLWVDEIIGFKQAVVWDKGGLGMGWHYRRNYEMVLVGQKPGAACKWYGGNSQPNVVRFPGIKPTQTDHPTPKPVGLMRLFIELHTAAGDLVLDPLMGAGTTGVAAIRAGRRFSGIEIERKWFELACRRIQATYDEQALFTGEPIGARLRQLDLDDASKAGG